MAEAAAKTADNTTPLKQDADKQEKAKRGSPGPRPCYVLLDQPFPEGVNIVRSTRKAEEALEAIDKGEAEAYIRIMVK